MRIVALVLCCAVSHAQEAAPVRVYVFTEKSADGFVDAVSQRRIDSVMDLQKAIAKRKGFAVAEAADRADVVLEVVQSADVEVAPVQETRLRRGILGTHLETTTEKQTEATLVTALRIPGSEYTISFTDQGHAWGFMAARTINALEKWVKANRARLAAPRR